MFPIHLRKHPATLAEVAQTKWIHATRKLMKKNLILHDDETQEIRQYIQSMLPMHLQTELLAAIIPRDKWKFPCSDPKDRFACKIHPECQLVHQRLV